MSAPAVAIRCDASAALGLGHLVRCAAVFDELARLEAEPVLVMREGAELAGGRRTAPPEALPGLGASTILLDLRHELVRTDVAALRASGLRVAVLDDPGERRLAAEIAFYPPVPAVARLDWSGFDGELLVGWEWVALRAAFAAPRPPRPSTRRVLVTMGGSDPAGLAVRAVGLLDLLPDLEPIVVVGPRFVHERALAAAVARSRHPVDVARNPDVRALMADADAALASFGMTAYELAATGVPAVHLCLTDGHAESATAFDEAGLAVSLGRHDLVGDEATAAAVARLLEERPPVPRLVDGLGARRIAERLLA